MRSVAKVGDRLVYTIIRAAQIDQAKGLIEKDPCDKIIEYAQAIRNVLRELPGYVGKEEAEAESETAVRV